MSILIKNNKNLTKNNLFSSFSESTISMILGAVVVIVVGILAYNYFRNNRQVVQPTSTTNAVNQTNDNGGILGESTTAVALPATHVVTSGETLWSIAERYYKSGYNFVDIAKVNNLSNPGSLEVGRKLTIPNVTPKTLTVQNAIKPTVTLSKIEGGSYTVQKGDYLWQISLRAYGDGYKWVEVAKANHLSNPGLIHAGNVLVIPR